MMFLILILLVYQAETKYILTEHKEGPVKHQLLEIDENANKPETKDHPKIREGNSNLHSGQEYVFDPENYSIITPLW